MHEVFISYSHKDEKIREAVCQKLEAEGIKCWYAPRNIQPGEEWADSITNALKQSKVMILIFTDNSNNSNQVLREVGLAVDFKEAIIPFKCDNTIPSGSMQYYLSTLHWLNAPDGPESALPELTELTKKALAGENKISLTASPEQKKPFPVKLILGIVIGILLLNAAIFAFLYSRGYLSRPGTQDKIFYSDEMADLILQDKRGFSARLQRLLQLGRAAKIHVICCTQSASRVTVPAAVAINFTCCVGLHAATAIESRQIISVAGCEKLPLYGQAIVKTQNGTFEKVAVPMYPEELLRSMRRHYTVQAIDYYRNLQKEV